LQCGYYTIVLLVLQELLPGEWVHIMAGLQYTVFSMRLIRFDLKGQARFMEYWHKWKKQLHFSGSCAKIRMR